MCIMTIKTVVVCSHLVAVRGNRQLLWVLSLYLAVRLVWQLVMWKIHFFAAHSLASFYWHRL